MLKKLKIFLCLLFAMIVPITFFGCKKDSSENNTTIETPTTPEDPDTTDPDESETETPDEDVGTFTVNISYVIPEKFSFLVEDITNIEVSANETYTIESILDTTLSAYISSYYDEDGNEISLFDGYYVNNEKLTSLEISGESGQQIDVVGRFNFSNMQKYFGSLDLNYGFDDDDETAYLVSCENSSSTLILPQYVYNESTQTYYKLTEISDYVFQDNENLTEILTYLSSIDIGESAFQNSALESFDFSICGIVGDYAFAGTNITEVKTSASLRRLGDYVFSDCKNLTTANLSGSVLTYVIPKGAFYGCSSLENVSIPSSITSIYESAFEKCTSLSNLDFLSITNLSVIKNYAFAGCTAINSLVIYSNIEELGLYAFAGCQIEELSLYRIYDSVLGTAITNFINGNSNNSDEDTSYFNNEIYLKKIYLLGSFITTIDSDAFSYLSYLEYFSLSSSVTTVSNYAFAGCTSLSEIVFPNDYTTGTFNILAYQDTPWLQNLNELILVNGTLLYVPESIKNITDELDLSSYISSGQSISVISSNTFTGALASKIIIPSSVTQILESAFKDCTNLEIVTFEEGSLLQQIGDSAFSNCSNLSQINLIDCTYLTTIGDSAFSSTGNITLMALPSSVSSIGTGVFRLSNIAEFSIDNSYYKSIDGVIYKLDESGNPISLVSYPKNREDNILILPETVTSIESYAVTAVDIYIVLQVSFSDITIASDAFIRSNLRILKLGDYEQSTVSNIRVYYELSVGYEIVDGELTILNEDAITQTYMFVATENYEQIFIIDSSSQEIKITQI